MVYDFLSKFWKIFTQAFSILVLIAVIIGSVYVLNGVVGLVAGKTIMSILGSIAGIGFIVETLSTGKLGGWEGSNAYDKNILFRLFYHTVFDWDGTIVRMVILREEFNFLEWQFTGET